MPIGPRPPELDDEFPDEDGFVGPFEDDPAADEIHLGGRRRVHRQPLYRDLRLRYLGLDQMGKGRAVEDGSGQCFLLNEDTEGFDQSRLSRGDMFLAHVTGANFVWRLEPLV
jgi:hypothetical protein